MKKYILIMLIPSMCFATSGRILNSSDNPYYISSVYDVDELRDIQYAQMNDVMYFVHPDHPPQKLTRYDHDNWAIVSAVFTNGPFLPENTDTSITITATGTGTTTANDYYDTGDDSQGLERDYLWDTQTFTAAATYTCSGVQLKLWREGNAGTVNVGLYATAAGKPTGTALTSGTIQANTLTTSMGGNWEEITFDSTYVLSSGTVYAIVVSAPAGDVFNSVYWRLDATSPTYAGGSYGGSVNSGVSWTMYATSDFMFRVVVYNSPSSVVSLTATADIFDADHVGSLWRIGDSGIVKILSVGTATQATVTIISSLSDTNPTSTWAEGAWSDYRGYPRAVCFFQNRLCMASTSYQPNMLWCSQSSDFENMDLGTGLDNEAIAREIGSAGQNPIMWIKDKKNGIIAGTTGAIIRVGTPDSSYVFTPSTINSERSVETGVSSIQPGLTVGSLVYVDRNRRKVRDLKYDVASDDMLSPDLTIFSDNITDPNVLEMVWQKRPDERGWFVRGDGHMAALTYIPSQGVEAWSELVTDGNYISVCSIPGTDEDEIWTAVTRDSSDYVLIEKFHNQDWTDDVWFIDSGLEYSGTATTVLTGLGHLAGETVQVYSDAGGYIGDFTVSSGGTITLSSSVTQAIAGLGYTSTIKTFPIEVATQMGPSVGMLKNIRLITLALYKSESGRYGYDTMYDILYPDYTTDFFSGLARLRLDTGYQMEAHVIIDQSEPLPLGVMGIAVNKYELQPNN